MFHCHEKKRNHFPNNPIIHQDENEPRVKMSPFAFPGNHQSQIIGFDLRAEGKRDYVVRNRRHSIKIFIFPFLKNREEERKNFQTVRRRKERNTIRTMLPPCFHMREGGRRCIDPIDISPRHNSIEYRMNASSPAGPTSIHFPLSNESRNSVHHDNFSYVKFFSANRPINRQFRVSIKNQEDFHFIVPSLRLGRRWKRNGGGVIYFYYLIFALLRGG